MMSLIKPQLSEDFLQSLSPVSNGAKTLTNIGMVGATTYQYYDDLLGHVQELAVTEEIYLKASNRLLTEHGYNISPQPNILVCDLNHGSDFLSGAFNDASIDLLILSSLYFCPADGLPRGPATVQSPYVGLTDSWKHSFQSVGAKAVLNLWFSWDKSGGGGISQLIKMSNTCDSVYKTMNGFVDPEVDSINDMYGDPKGAELFLARSPV